MASTSTHGDATQHLEVIGAGFGRTGTMSLQAALDVLYAPKRCYHFGSIFQNQHIFLWQDALKERRSPDWVRILEQNRYVATMDHPCAEYYKDSMQRYPQAKVILSEHPGGLDKWYQAKLALESINTAMFSWPLKPLAALALPVIGWLLFKQWIPYSFNDMICFVKLVEGNVWGERGVLDKENAMQVYELRYTEVKAAVPADRLLVFNVSMGWGPLCQFLGKPVPDAPFPQEDSHSSKNIKKTLWRVQAVVWVLYASISIGTARACHKALIARSR